VRSPIATLGVAAVLALVGIPEPAHADGIDDICLIVTVSGVVNGSAGHCQPTTGTTHEFREGVGQTGLVWVEVYIRYP